MAGAVPSDRRRSTALTVTGCNVEDDGGWIATVRAFQWLDGYVTVAT